MKRLKGLYKDTLAVDQPEGTYRHAMNANLNMKVGGISAEEGFEELSTVLPLGSIFLGSVSVNGKKSIIFSTDDTGKSEIGSFENYEYKVVLNSPLLNFNMNSIISSTVKKNNDLEDIVYWTDGINPPRMLNIDNPPTITSADDLNLFFNFKSAITLDLNTVRSFGGALLSGSYQIAVAYLDKDGNGSNIVSITNPINVIGKKSNNVADLEIEGYATESVTSSSIVIDIDNIDTRYDRLQFFVIHNTDGTIGSVKKLSPIKIHSPSRQFIFTGQETYTGSSLDEISINKTSYDTAKYLTQQDDTLYLANLTRGKDINYQKYANNIEVTAVSKNVSAGNYFVADNGFEMGDSDIVYYNKSFKRGEVYAFYISFILKDGTESKAYIISGRLPEGTENEPINQIENDGNKFFKIDPSAKQFHLYARPGSNGLSYWENEQETYPDTEDFDVYDVKNVGGVAVGSIHDTKPTLRGAPVRHHRFPEIQYREITKQNLDPYSNIYSSDFVNILGIEIKNVKIPSEIKDKVLGFRIYHAEKNASNSLVMGSSLLIPQREDEVGGTKVYKNDLMHYNTDTESNPKEINTSIFSVHPFELMRAKENLSALAYVKNYAVAGNERISFERPTSGGTEHVYLSSDLFPRDKLVDNDVNRIRVVESSSYIPSNTDLVTVKGLGFTYDKSSSKEESQILLRLDTPLKQSAYAGKGTSNCIFSWLTTLHAHLKDPFNSFDEQLLVWTGIVATDLGRFDPSHPAYGDGHKATGSLEVVDTSQAASGRQAKAAVDCFIKTPITSPIAFNIVYDNVILGTVNLDSSTVDKGDIVEAIRDEVNGNPSSYPFTAIAYPLVGSIEFTHDNYSATPNGKEITFSMSGNIDFNDFIEMSPELPISFFGGLDPNGVVYVRLDDAGTGITASYVSGDTEEDVVNKLMYSYNNDLNTIKTDYILTSVGNKIYFESRNEGTEWNKLITIYTTISVGISVSQLSGGTEHSNSLSRHFGGDTYVCKYGVRVTNDDDNHNKKFLYRAIVESTDNITMRHSGNSFGELNPNLSKHKLNILNYEKDDKDSSNETMWDNFYGYDISYHKQGDTKTAIPNPKYINEYYDFPTRIIRSQEQDFTSLDRFRTFLDSDYLDLPKNRGEITNLAILDNILIIHMERALYRTKGREQLVTGDFRAFLGSGNIFEIKPDELRTTTHGFAGTSSPKGTVEFEGGYFFINDEAKKIYLMTDGVADLTEIGMRGFFRENLTWFLDDVIDKKHIPFIGLSADYDSEYNRILFTKVDYSPTQELLDDMANAEEYSVNPPPGAYKYVTFNYETGKFRQHNHQYDFDIEYNSPTYFVDKSFTISYLPEIQAWISFHSYMPLFYFSNSTELFSMDGNSIYKHNNKEEYALYCTYYNEEQHPFHFQFVENPSPEETKQLVNIEFQLNSGRGSFNRYANFNRFRVRNDYQDSGDIDIRYFTLSGGNARSIGDTWRINKFRDIMFEGALKTDLVWHKQKRFTGKYALIDLYYDTVDDDDITLISATANFKESIR